MRYEAIPELSVGDVEAAILRNEPEELLVAVLSAALHGSSLKWAEGVCRKLSAHAHFKVRGNAILCFGHLARIHGRLDRSAVVPIIEAGLVDANEYVRGQAEAAANDVEHSL